MTPDEESDRRADEPTEPEGPAPEEDASNEEAPAVRPDPGTDPDPSSRGDDALPAAEDAPADDVPGDDATDDATIGDPDAPTLRDAAGGDSPMEEAAAPGIDEDDAYRPAPEDVDLKLPLLLLLVPVGIGVIGSLLLPRIFWDRFIDPYYWDPIVRDTGFQFVNTISWAILMALLIFLMMRVAQKIEQPVKFALIVGTLPYMVGGSITRVLQDTGFFVEPLRYFFITPIIYVVIVFTAVFWLVVGHFLSRHSEEAGPLGGVKALGAFFAIIWAVYTAWSSYGDQLAHYGHPIILLLAFAVPLTYFWHYTKQTGRFSQVGAMATFGVAYMLFMGHYVLIWHMGPQWPDIAADFVRSPDVGTELRPYIYLLMFAAPAVFVGAVYWFAKQRAAESTTMLAFMAPVNLLIIGAQTLDAAMTSYGIDVLGYREKHWLPRILIGGVRDTPLVGMAGTIVMLPIKFIVALLVVWAIDVYARNDVKKYPDLVGLAKLAIIMVGFAPGVRDAVRMAMGV